MEHVAVSEVTSNSDIFCFEIETDLYHQISELIAPMNISHEKLIEAFLRWCTDPDTQGMAKDWLQTATKARHYHDARKENL